MVSQSCTRLHYRVLSLLMLLLLFIKRPNFLSNSNIHLFLFLKLYQCNTSYPVDPFNVFPWLILYIISNVWKVLYNHFIFYYSLLFLKNTYQSKLVRSSKDSSCYDWDVWPSVEFLSKPMTLDNICFLFGLVWFGLVLLQLLEV